MKQTTRTVPLPDDTDVAEGPASAAETTHRRYNAGWLTVPLVIVGFTALAGYRLLRLANADALLPGLFSTQEMTWFYWGQDRLANVVPLLATPVQDLRWNLALQLFLTGLGWFTLIAMFAANHQCRGDRHITPLRLTVVLIVSATLNLALLKSHTRWVFIFEQLYAFSTVLLLAGLIALTRDRIVVRVMGVGVVIVAMMINPSLLLLAPVVLVIPQRSATRWGRATAAATSMVVAFVLASIASAAFGTATGSAAGYSSFSPRVSLRNLGTTFDRIRSSMNFTLAVVIVVIACGMVALRWHSLDRRRQATLVGAAVFAVGWTVLFTGNAWIAANGSNERYFFPIFAATHLLVTAAVSETVDMVYERVPPERRLAARLLLSRRSALATIVATTLVLSAFTVWRFTRSSMDVLVAARPAADAARASNAQFVLGDYWTAWPVVVLGRMDGNDLEGIVYRFDPRRDDVGTAIDSALAANGEFNVVCTWTTAQECMNWLHFFTGETFELGRLVSESPLILTVRSPTS